jgi:hypothetical protein
MDSRDLARYIEANDGLAKPWLLMQLRISKLQEERANLEPEEYTARLAEMHDELMRLGRWWEGREKEVFGE